jgi:streptogramin lyase
MGTQPQRPKGLGKVSVLVCLTLLAPLLSLPQNAGAVDYTFTKIADTSGEFDAFGGEPAINNKGEVSFHGEFDAGGEGIFKGSGGPITTIVNSNTFGFNFGGISSINDNGEVAFRSPPGIFKGSGGPITTIADATGPFASFITDGPWINNNGEVAFFATLDTGDEGAFKGNGTSITTIADGSGPFDLFGIYPSINDNGEVAFEATLDAGGEGVFTGSGGPITTIADTTGAFSSFSNRVSISNNGTVFFETPEGRFAGKAGGPFTPFVDFRDVFFPIAHADPLFSTAGLIASPFQSINHAGRIAFFARFPDGSEAIYRADPAPEPTAVLLVPNNDGQTATNGDDRILRFGGKTGALIDVFVPPGSGGLSGPFELTFGPDGNLYVVNNTPGADSVLRYDGQTGTFIDVFATGLSVPQDLAFGPDGNLYVTNGFTFVSSVSRFNGTTGAFIDTFVISGSGGLDGPHGLAFGPDGNLYVASAFTDSVFRYDGTTGAFIDQFVAPNSGGLSVPVDLVFGPDGNLYVNTQVPGQMVPGGIAGAVLRYDGVTGAFVDAFVSAGSGDLGLPKGGLLFMVSQVMSITIDIKPGSDRNPINPRSKFKIPVAILTTDAFDATTVDPATVAFGPTGAGIGHRSVHFEDVDGDGDLDLVLHFRTQETGIACGDTEASLSGKTFDGTSVEGSDSIVTVGCK